MIDPDQAERDIAAALTEAQTSNALRTRLRWRAKPGSAKRERDIARRLDAIDAAMKPLRSHIGKLHWHPVSDDLETRLRSASAQLQHERKQLKKMRRPS